jgi:hypothetical protein
MEAASGRGPNIAITFGYDLVEMQTPLPDLLSCGTSAPTRTTDVLNA